MERLKFRSTVGKIFKPIGIGIIFLLGLTALCLSIYQLAPVKNKYPWLDNQIRAYVYDYKARDFPAGDYAAKRYRAMAEALRQGKHDYKFETGPLPTMK